MLTDSLRQPFFTLCVMLLHVHYTNGDIKVICEHSPIETYPTEKCTHVITKDTLYYLDSEIPTFEEQFSTFENDTDNSKERILQFMHSGNITGVYDKAASFAKEKGYHGMLVPYFRSESEEAHENIYEPIIRHGLELYVNVHMALHECLNDSRIKSIHENITEKIKNKSQVNLIISIRPTREQFKNQLDGSEVDTQRPYWEERINFFTELGFPASNLIIMVNPVVFYFYISKGLLPCKFDGRIHEFCQFHASKNVSSTNTEREIRWISKLKPSRFLGETNNFREKQVQFLVNKNFGGFFAPGIILGSEFRRLDEDVKTRCIEEIKVFMKPYIDVGSKSGQVKQAAFL